MVLSLLVADWFWYITGVSLTLDLYLNTKPSPFIAYRSILVGMSAQDFTIYTCVPHFWSVP